MNKKYRNKIMEYALTSHNRTVYASPPAGGNGLKSRIFITAGQRPAESVRR
jgi:hypothetical protein